MVEKLEHGVQLFRVNLTIPAPRRVRNNQISTQWSENNHLPSGVKLFKSSSQVLCFILFRKTFLRFSERLFSDAGVGFLTHGSRAKTE